jgi:hypothetical protein
MQKEIFNNSNYSMSGGNANVVGGAISNREIISNSHGRGGIINDNSSNVNLNNYLNDKSFVGLGSNISNINSNANSFNHSPSPSPNHLSNSQYMSSRGS